MFINKPVLKGNGQLEKGTGQLQAHSLGNTIYSHRSNTVGTARNGNTSSRVKQNRASKASRASKMSNASRSPRRAKMTINTPVSTGSIKKSVSLTHRDKLMQQVDRIQVATERSSMQQNSSHDQSHNQTYDQSQVRMLSHNALQELDLNHKGNNHDLGSIIKSQIPPDIHQKYPQRNYDQNTNDSQKKNEFVKQFGSKKGNQYYGAIRELEEFLDPNVLNDEEFNLNQKTKDDINTIEGNIKYIQTDSNANDVTPRGVYQNQGAHRTYDGIQKSRVTSVQRSLKQSRDSQRNHLNLGQTVPSKNTGRSITQARKRSITGNYVQQNPSEVNRGSIVLSNDVSNNYLNQSDIDNNLSKVNQSAIDNTYFQEQLQTSQHNPMHVIPFKKVKQPKQGSRMKPKINSVQKKIFGQNSGENDMLLMNLRMNMHTQEYKQRAGVVNARFAPSPVMAHAYGYNDSIGELRSQTLNGGVSLGSKETIVNHKQIKIQQQYTGLPPGYNQLIFDPQNKQNLVKTQLTPFKNNQIETSVTPDNLPNNMEADNAFAQKKHSNFTSLNNNMEVPPPLQKSRPQRHKSVNNRTNNFQTTNKAHGQIPSEMLPLIGGKGSQFTSFTKGTQKQNQLNSNILSNNMFKKNRLSQHPQQPIMAHPQQSDYLQYNIKNKQDLRDQSPFFSSKSKTKTGLTSSRGNITPFVYDQDDKQFQSPGITTKDTSKFDAMQVNSTLKSAQEYGMMQHQPRMNKRNGNVFNNQITGGKIILKKINHFFDKEDINKVYKNDLRKINQQYTDTHIINNSTAKIQKSSKKKLQHHKTQLNDGCTILSKTEDLTQRTYQDAMLASTSRINVTRNTNGNETDDGGQRISNNASMTQGIRKDKSPRAPRQNDVISKHIGMIDIVDQNNDSLADGSRVKFAHDDSVNRAPGEIYNIKVGRDKSSVEAELATFEKPGSPLRAVGPNGKELDPLRIIKKSQVQAKNAAKRPAVPGAPLNYFKSHYGGPPTQPLSKKQEKNLLSYINNKMKVGDAVAGLQYSNLNQAPTHQKQPEAIDTSVTKTKQRSKKRTHFDVARNKSAPKRNKQRDQDQLRSMPNQQALNRLLIGKQFKAEDDQILNIKIQSSTKRNKQLNPSSSQRHFDQMASQTQQITFYKPRISTVHRKNRIKHKSPMPAQKQSVYNTGYGSGQNDTLQSHREKRKNFLFKYQASASSIYKQNQHDNRILSNSRSSKRQRINSAGGDSVYSIGSNVQSEVHRAIYRNSTNNKQMLMLDSHNLRQLKNPESIRNKGLLIPEGYSTDHKKDLQEIYSVSSRHNEKYKDHPMRSGSAQSLYEKSKGYKFQLKDLSKYSMSLKYKDINWKIHLSALGKTIPDINKRKKILIKGSHFNTLLKLLRSTDWSSTPVYHQFMKNGRWKHEDDNIYSDLEIQYHISYLNKFVNNENRDEIDQDDALPILDRYLEKTMHTLEVLMNQLNMMYYWEKIRLMFTDQIPTLSQLCKLLSRCLKLYQQIDTFVKIFKLITKKEQLDAKGVSDATLIKRILITIKLLLKENPILPTAFHYKGKCLIEQLIREQRELGIEPTEITRSPSKKALKLKPQNTSNGTMDSQKLTGMSPGRNNQYSQDIDVDSLKDSMLGDFN